MKYQLNVTRLIGNLAVDVENKTPIYQTDKVVDMLMPLLTTGNASMREETIIALRNIAEDTNNRVPLVQKVSSINSYQLSQIPLIVVIHYFIFLI